MLNVMVVQNRKPEPQQMLEPIKQHIKKKLNIQSLFSIELLYLELHFRFLGTYARRFYIYYFGMRCYSIQYHVLNYL